MLDSSLTPIVWVVIAVAGAITLHEGTHVLVARLCSPISMERRSALPLRIQITFERDVTATQAAIVAVAPTMVGIALAVGTVATGFWQEISTAEPYYFHILVLLNWLLYSAPSPADIRVLSS